MSIKLSELQKAILWMLEEAGAENICCIANTLTIDKDRILDFYVALKDLWKLNAILTEFPIEKTQINSDFGMKYEEGSWNWPQKGEIPQVILTETGAKLLET